jgi:hypothetical protein
MIVVSILRKYRPNTDMLTTAAVLALDDHCPSRTLLARRMSPLP